jgi:hypothetical protein
MSTSVLQSPGDEQRSVTVWLRILEPLDEAQRREKYDDPLSVILANEGVEHEIRGFSLPVDANHNGASVGIEIDVPEMKAFATIVRALMDIGAPPTTVLELEGERASIQCTLTEANVD